MTDLWIEKVHEEYEERRQRDEYTRDHYTGAVKDKAIAKAKTLKDGQVKDSSGTVIGVKRDFNDIYLYRRPQGESVDNYIERVVISKFPRHHATVIDSFAGSIFAVEHKSDRTMEAFGDVEDVGSFAYRLWRNADGFGTNYLTMFKRATAMFMNYNRVWYLVEEDTFKWLPGYAVKNWLFDANGTLTDALVEEIVDSRQSLEDDYEEIENRKRWVHYHTDGFDRYRIVKDKGGERKIEHIKEESGLWEFPHYDDIDVSRITVPMGYVDLPISSNPGYSMAQEANYLYNFLSDARIMYRIANHPLLNAVDADDDMFELRAVKLMQGSRFLQGDNQYTSPDVSNAIGAYNTYKEEVRDFFVTSHQRYNDAAREITATEARQDDLVGRQSLLILLSGTLDELDNRIQFMLAQKQFPTDRSKWLVNSVNRSTDFKPQDSNEFAERLAKRYFTGPVPIGETGLNNVVKNIAALDGIEVDDGEIDANIAEQELDRQQQEASDAELNALLEAA